MTVKLKFKRYSIFKKIILNNIYLLNSKQVKIVP